MLEAIDLQGIWWLPRKPDDQISGVLTYTPRGRIQLDLQGDFVEKFDFETFFHTLVLLGLSTNGKKITLTNCYLTKRNSNSPGLSTSTLVATSALIGTHFESPEAIKFKTITMHYANLDEWVNRSGFNSSYDESGNLTLKYERPQEIKFKAGGYDLSVWFSWEQRDERFTTVMSQKALFTITSEKLIELEECFTLVRRIQDFLTLAMARATYPTEVTGLLDDTAYAPVSIIYDLPRWPAEAGEVYAHQMLFTLPMVENQMAILFDNWLSKSEMLQPVYALYFSTLYNSQIYTDASFLNFTQALETYHRRILGGKYQPDDEFRKGLYQELLAALPNDLEPGFKDSLKRGKLYYANEFSLRKRLQELTSRLVGKIPLAFVDAQRNAFVEDVCNTRNYLTHYDPDLLPKIAIGRHLYELRQQLKILIEICLLEQSGFDLTTIYNMLKRRREYQEFLAG